MVIWFVITAVLTIHFVFRDPAFDYRLLIVGSVIPVVGDISGGWGSALNTIGFAVALLAIVMIVSIGNRERRRRTLGLPIGVLLHMVFGGAWSSVDIFWWPVSGLNLGDAPALLREHWTSAIAREAIGIACALWMMRRTNLLNPDARRTFKESGKLNFP